MVPCIAAAHFARSSEAAAAVEATRTRSSRQRLSNGEHGGTALGSKVLIRFLSTRGFTYTNG